MSDKKSTFKTILDALGVLKDHDPSLVKALAEDAGVDPTLVAKGEIDSHRSGGLGSKTEYVKDGWSEGMVNKAPAREELNIGPGQEASGHGAEKMVKEYSNPATQHHGIEIAVEKLGQMFMGFGKSMMEQQTAFMKAMSEENKSIKALIIQSAISKADSEEEEDDEEDESEVVEINASRAKAKALIAQIKVTKSKSKKAALVKALNAILTEIDEAAAKSNASIRALCAKADIEVIQEEEEEDDEEEEADKAKKAQEAADAAAKAAAAKATTDDKGNQADHEDPKNGNQAAAAKTQADAAALAKTQNDIANAVKGLGILEASVKDMMNVVMGKTKIAETLPDIAKAKPDSIQALIDNVQNMQNSGSITPADAAAALDIASMTREAAAGRMDGAIAKSRLEKSSTTVRSLFADAINTSQAA